MTVRVEPADIEDLVDLLSILTETGEAAQWTEEQLRDVLERCGAETGGARVVAWRAGMGDPEEVAGFAVAEWVGIEGEPAELLNLAVRPAARRRGMGRALCDAVAGWSRLQGAAGVLLEVRSRNLGAIALYEGMGWRCVARRRGYYSQPADDALVFYRSDE